MPTQVFVQQVFCRCHLMGRSCRYFLSSHVPSACVRARWDTNSVSTVRGFVTSPVQLQQQKEKSRTGKELDIKRQSPYEGLSPAEKVKEAGKDAAYTGFIIAGVGVLGVMTYFIGRELLSSDSPSGVFSRSLKLCKKNEEITDLLGEPIKGYGETTRRGRRRHVSHVEYLSDGVKHMRMKFYIEGPYRKGTVHADVFQNSSGHYQYRYLFVEIDDYPRKTIVLEDNR